MIAIVAPEPAPWLPRAVEAAAGIGPVWLFAPFALRAPPPFLPERLRAPWLRRHLAVAARVQGVPGWLAAEAGLRGWVGDRADRRIRARMLTRAAVDALAARALPTEARVVIAPSFAARRTFAVAEQRGARRLLVEDLPVLRQLHADLDRAARAHPSSRFLLRHRASAREVARQEMERVLAERVLVRGRFAREALVGGGLPASRIAPLDALGDALLGKDAPPEPEGLSATAPASGITAPRRRVLLAGLAAARNGSFEALAAIEQLPGLTLLVRPGEGLEPDELLHHPRVKPATEEERRALSGVDAVLAPAWCEGYPEEVPLAASRGIPVIATSRAAGWLELAIAGREVAPGDLDGLVEALRGEAAARARPAHGG